MNKSSEKPYIPARNPRDVNVVNRIKELRNRQPVHVNDDTIEMCEVDKLLASMVAESIPVGGPGGFVKLNEQGVIEPSCLPPSSGGSSVRTAKTHLEFPTVGIEDVIYIATEENNGKGYIYRWCDSLNCYERPDDNLDSVSEIYGGSAEVV